MNGVVVWLTAMASPAGLKATLSPSAVGNVAGSVHFTPNPVAADQGYAVMNGVLLWLTAMASPAGLKATPLPAPVGNVAGLLYFTPKPVAPD